MSHSQHQKSSKKLKNEPFVPDAPSSVPDEFDGAVEYRMMINPQQNPHSPNTIANANEYVYVLQSGETGQTPALAFSPEYYQHPTSGGLVFQPSQNGGVRVVFVQAPSSRVEPAVVDPPEDLSSEESEEELTEEQIVANLRKDRNDNYYIPLAKYVPSKSDLIVSVAIVFVVFVIATLLVMIGTPLFGVGLHLLINVDFGPTRDCSNFCFPMILYGGFSVIIGCFVLVVLCVFVVIFYPFILIIATPRLIFDVEKGILKRQNVRYFRDICCCCCSSSSCVEDDESEIEVKLNNIQEFVLDEKTEVGKFTKKKAKKKEKKKPAKGKKGKKGKIVKTVAEPGKLLAEMYDGSVVEVIPNFNPEIKRRYWRFLNMYLEHLRPQTVELDDLDDESIPGV